MSLGYSLLWAYGHKKNIVNDSWCSSPTSSERSSKLWPETAASSGCSWHCSALSLSTPPPVLASELRWPAHTSLDIPYLFFFVGLFKGASVCEIWIFFLTKHWEKETLCSLLVSNCGLFVAQDKTFEQHLNTMFMFVFVNHFFGGGIDSANPANPADPANAFWSTLD